MADLPKQSFVRAGGVYYQTAAQVYFDQLWSSTSTRALAFRRHVAPFPNLTLTHDPTLNGAWALGARGPLGLT